MVDVEGTVPVNNEVSLLRGVIGQHLKAESTSRVAASEREGASITMRLTSLKVPQSQVKSSMFI